MWVNIRNVFLRAAIRKTSVKTILSASFNLPGSILSQLWNTVLGRFVPVQTRRGNLE